MAGAKPFPHLRDALSPQSLSAVDSLFDEIDGDLGADDPREKLRNWAAEENAGLLRRQAEFRLAADAVARAFAKVPYVAAIVMFGSVAQPLQRRVPRSRKLRRAGVELWHHCKDVDLAVWVDRLDSLSELGRARGKAVQRLLGRTGIGVAHHQLDIFLMQPVTNRYLGRLCWYRDCPKGKIECLVPGCGREKLLRQHEDFALRPDALAEDRIIRLYDRASGLQCSPPPVPGMEGRGGRPGG